MAHLPRYDRAIVIVPPHGDYIAEGRKTALVKSRRYYMEDEVLLVVQSKRAIGTLVLAAPKAITLAEFRRKRHRHLVTEEERARWWPRKTALYLYDILEFRPIAAPVPVEYPRGAQTFVRPTALRLARGAP